MKIKVQGLKKGDVLHSITGEDWVITHDAEKVYMKALKQDRILVKMTSADGLPIEEYYKPDRYFNISRA